MSQAPRRLRDEDTPAGRLLRRLEPPAAPSASDEARAYRALEHRLEGPRWTVRLLGLGATAAAVSVAALLWLSTRAGEPAQPGERVAAVHGVPGVFVGQRLASGSTLTVPPRGGLTIERSGQRIVRVEAEDQPVTATLDGDTVALRPSVVRVAAELVRGAPVELVFLGASVRLERGSLSATSGPDGVTLTLEDGAAEVTPARGPRVRLEGDATWSSPREERSGALVPGGGPAVAQEAPAPGSPSESSAAAPPGALRAAAVPQRAPDATGDAPPKGPDAPATAPLDVGARRTPGAAGAAPRSGPDTPGERQGVRTPEPAAPVRASGSTPREGAGEAPRKGASVPAADAAASERLEGAAPKRAPSEGPGAAASERLVARATEQLRRGDVTSAARLYAEAAQGQGPGSATALYELGLLQLTRLRQPRLAVDTFRDYLRRFPDGALGLDAHVSLIEALLAAHHFTDAEAEASAFIARHPSGGHSDEIRLIRANIHREWGDCEGAERDYAALEEGAHAVDALYFRALCARRAGELDRSRALLRRLEALAPDSPRLRDAARWDR